MSLSSLQIKMLRRLLQSATEDKIAHAIDKIDPADLTILFSEISDSETERLINSLRLVAKAGKTIMELPEFMIPDVLESIDNGRLSEIIGKLEPDDALFLLQKMPESRSFALLETLPSLLHSKVDRLLLYPKNSAGSLMTTSFITLKADMTVEQALHHLRHQTETPGVFYIYVVDDLGKLVGVQPMRNLITSEPAVKIREIMDPMVQAILATATQEEAAQKVAQYNLLAIPVINDQQELVGIITVDDVIDVIKDEATEDIYHLAGLSEEDRAMTPTFVKIKKRLPWMMLNLLTASLAASVVGFFQGAIQEFVALAVFMPIVAGMGGNGATQSLTVITRSIALGELAFIKAYKAILREVGNGLVLGIMSGLIMGLLGYLWKGNIYLGGVLFLAMTLNMITGGLMGAVIPLAFKRMKLDPAVGTSVIVTMFTDVLGFLFFLGLATIMMEWMVV